MKGLFAAALIAWLISGTVHASVPASPTRPAEATAATAFADTANADHAKMVVADIRTAATCTIRPGAKRLAC